jgi:hypothetical protein
LGINRFAKLFNSTRPEDSFAVRNIKGEDGLTISFRWTLQHACANTEGAGRLKKLYVVGRSLLNNAVDKLPMQEMIAATKSEARQTAPFMVKATSSSTTTEPNREFIGGAVTTHFVEIPPIICRGQEHLAARYSVEKAIVKNSI